MKNRTIRVRSCWWWLLNPHKVMSKMSTTGETNPSKPDRSCKRPSKCDPCGAQCMSICGTNNPNLTCRPGGRAWGRACGPVSFKEGKWIEPSLKSKKCKPVNIFGPKTNRLPYGFGIYARKLYPYGLPCVGNFFLPKPRCNVSFYPMLPTKPAKTYSSYTYQTRGPPYTCPRPCIAATINE